MGLDPNSYVVYMKLINGLNPPVKSIERQIV